MLKLVYLRELDIPFIILSATIPPMMERELSIALGTTFTSIIRQGTVRSRLHYGVQWVTNKILASGTQGVAQVPA
ncbi:predicted protein [Lichtheimia corymbifera JMRC:FSU:9682]|uniref:Helicase ATP-binding domain-containing protein n=1 Tax=Lichtheimia corymbifera JMRC:FSU:9682 TaxID=1263082 RepID=A0A068S7X0_9FUNG|nr:predicted protein [Lichtheimia corymbifera JMRC:FSU:9682]